VFGGWKYPPKTSIVHGKKSVMKNIETIIDAIKYHFFALLSIVLSILDDNDEVFFFSKYRNIKISATIAGIIFKM
jgi:hypothetical protein